MTYIGLAFFQEVEHRGAFLIAQAGTREHALGDAVPLVGGVVAWLARDVAQRAALVEQLLARCEAGGGGGLACCARSVSASAAASTRLVVVSTGGGS